MAGDNLVNLGDLVVGNVVSFRSSRLGARYEGKIFFFTPHNTRFGIEKVTCIGSNGKRIDLSGVYINGLQYIEDLRVIERADPNAVSDEDEEMADASSGNNNQAARGGPNASNTQAGQNSNGASGATNVNQAARSGSSKPQVRQVGRFRIS
ncbi:unnamed protein product [Microthlaspi erraticum]|uniref:Uncharacterized protein n=1 Tax=Microthlaspi erraticum TaxID=1685480 RepID=A0A6D2KPF8_9BRAS|nr:unnamed protein product [Microthlaspi erraticum]